MEAIYDWTAALGYLLFKVVLLPQMLWDRPGMVDFPEPKPLVPIWPEPVTTPFDWPPSVWHTESDLVLSSFALVGTHVQLRPRGGGYEVPSFALGLPKASCVGAHRIPGAWAQVIPQVVVLW